MFKLSGYDKEEFRQCMVICCGKRKRNLFLMIIAVVFIMVGCSGRNNSKTIRMETKIDSTIFPKGEQGPLEWFTGTVWVTTLMKPNENLHYVISDVKFEPGARTYWHIHPVEQVLLVTEGNGFYQEKGKTARVLHKGDVVVIPPMSQHWHGAAPDSKFTHVAITNYKDGENVTWLQAVTGEEYNGVISMDLDQQVKD